MSDQTVAGIVCADCGKTALRTGPVQKYCRPCSERRDLIRKKLWARVHPPKRDSVNESAKYRRRKDALAVIGKTVSADESRGITWMSAAPPDLMWLVRVSVPFTYRLSKNALYGTNPRGHVFLREEARAARASVISAIARAMRGRKVAKNKLWIDILVQKPNHLGDAVNVLDSVCDGIKKAIPLDDRWYCIRQVDWQIVKDRPRLFIGIGQDTDVDAQVCAICGRILPLDKFSKNASNKCGISRECSECRNAVRRKPANPRVEVTVEEAT